MADVTTSQILGVTVLMHDTQSTWSQRVVFSDALPVTNSNMQVLAILAEPRGTYRPGLYYWPGDRWIYILTDSQLGQVFTADFTVDAYYKWFQGTATQSDALVYQNTTPRPSGTTVPANSTSVYVVMTPTGGGGGGGGIPDAPNNNTAYVRKNLSWSDLNQQVITEGNF